MRVLYLTYDGLSEGLGYSQVFSYVKYLSAKNEITLISFEKPQFRDRVESLRDEVKAAGIRWYPLRYHKSPSVLATAFDIVHGIALALSLSVPRRFQIVHSRSYVVAVVALVVKKITGAAFLFDIRGFWVEERVESGIWKADTPLVKIAKLFEKAFFKNADQVVSLTHAGANIIRTFDYLKDGCPPIEVITTCTDLARFSMKVARKQNDRFVVGYVGSAGLWYDFGATAKCFRMLVDKRPDLKPFLYIVNQHEQPQIRSALRDAGIPENDYFLTSCSQDQMPGEFQKMDAGIFFIRPSYSKQASAPTKLGEYLGSGIPCLINANIGDSGAIVKENNVGAVVNDFASASLQKGLEQLIALCEESDTQSRCRRVAEKFFSLQGGVEKYAEIYRKIGNNSLLHPKDLSHLPI